MMELNPLNPGIDGRVKEMKEYQTWLIIKLGELEMNQDIHNSEWQSQCIESSREVSETLQF